MDLKKLHAKFRDNDSPSVEGQIQWLRKQGFEQHQIDKAILTVYSAIDRGLTPLLFKLKKSQPGDGITILESYGADASESPGEDWDQREIVTGKEIDAFLLKVAKGIRTDELSEMIAKMEAFEDSLRNKWEEDIERKAIKLVKSHWWNKK